MTKEFMNAVESKNRKAIYFMLKDSLLVDPTATQFEEMLSYSNHMMGDIYEEHDGEEFEQNPSEWNQSYLFEQLERMVNNFSMERVALVKDMAKHLSDNGNKDISAWREYKTTSKMKIWYWVRIVLILCAVVFAFQGLRTENLMLDILALGICLLDRGICRYFNQKIQKEM